MYVQGLHQTNVIPTQQRAIAPARQSAKNGYHVYHLPGTVVVVGDGQRGTKGGATEKREGEGNGL